MIRYIKTFFLLKSFRDFNNSEFKKIKNKKSDNIVLIEFNSFNVIHIIFAYFSFFFKKKNYTIKSFYSHILLTYQLNPSLKQKIFRFISPLFNLGFYGLIPGEAGPPAFCPPPQPSVFAVGFAFAFAFAF